MHNTKDCHMYKKDGTEKANFGTAKKGRKKPNPAKQSFAQLSKKLEKLEKAIKKESVNGKKHCHSNSDSDSEQGVGLGSIGKVEIKLGKTVKKTKFTPPSLIKATPNVIAINHRDICPMSFSNIGDIMMTSSSQNKGLHVNYSTLTNKDPPDGKTTAVIAVMRGKSKDSYHCCWKP
jgi:hypothetical protein